SPVWAPIVVPRVTWAMASPFASVVVVAGSMAAPGALEVKLNATDTPCTGRPRESVTSATSGSLNGSPTRPDWLLPAVMLMWLATPSPGSRRPDPPPQALRARAATRPAKRTAQGCGRWIGLEPAGREDGTDSTLDDNASLEEA